MEGHEGVGENEAALGALVADIVHEILMLEDLVCITIHRLWQDAGLLALKLNSLDDVFLESSTLIAPHIELEGICCDVLDILAEFGEIDRAMEFDAVPEQIFN